MSGNGRVVVRVRGTRTQVIAPYLDKWRIEARRLGGRYRARGKFWSFDRYMPIPTLINVLGELYGPELISDQTQTEAPPETPKAKDKHIEYWLDDVSDHDDPRWIVSLESGGGSSTLRVLDAGATEGQAHALAETLAATMNVEVRGE